ncbi:hypothetical protein AZKH_1464 [Azoarcus sp. KH32C]|nr:hypothetical protein AZKH_1464 [Azoarcus sp. KH32C]
MRSQSDSGERRRFLAFLYSQGGIALWSHLICPGDGFSALINDLIFARLLLPVVPIPPRHPLRELREIQVTAVRAAKLANEPSVAVALAPLDRDCLNRPGFRGGSNS